DVNGAGEELFGLSRAEIVGHSFMEFVPPERLESARSYLADRLKGLRATELYEATFAAADLKPLHVQLRSQVVRPSDAEPYVVYIVRDVTAQREAMRIQEVFVNLLKNAYEATPRGRVRIRLQDLGSLVAVSISDTGSGIPPEIQSRLFEAFFTTKKKGEGTGLGLAISRNFVASHGGDITLTSEPGKGTTFTVVLPKQAPGGRAPA